METSQPGNKIKKIHSQMGPPHVIKKLDKEWVIYRELGPDYEVEVSGLDNARETFRATAFVWRRSKAVERVETIEGIRSVTALKRILGGLNRKYAGTPV